jgi:hypothetical protein
LFDPVIVNVHDPTPTGVTVNVALPMVRDVTDAGIVAMPLQFVVDVVKVALSGCAAVIVCGALAAEANVSDVGVRTTAGAGGFVGDAPGAGGAGVGVGVGCATADGVALGVGIGSAVAGAPGPPRFCVPVAFVADDAPPPPPQPTTASARTVDVAKSACRIVLRNNRAITVFLT